MLKTLKIKTQLMSAAMTAGMFMATSGASAQDFNTYTKNLSGQVSGMPDVVGYISYLGGFALAALGVVGLKQHVENPGNNPMKNGLAKLGFGGMLLALPSVVSAIQGSGEAGGSATVNLNQFNATGLQ
jgi:hypothetical protein